MAKVRSRESRHSEFSCAIFVEEIFVKADKFTNFDLIAASSGSSIATVVVVAGSQRPLSHAISWYFAVFKSQRTCLGGLSASCAWLAFISRFRLE